MANRAREVRSTLGTCILILPFFCGLPTSIVVVADDDGFVRWLVSTVTLMACFDGDVDGSRADGLRGLVLMPVGFC